MQIPEYQRYNNERDIALLDNSSISFLYELNSNGISISPILSETDSGMGLERSRGLGIKRFIHIIPQGFRLSHFHH